MTGSTRMCGACTYYILRKPQDVCILDNIGIKMLDMCKSTFGLKARRFE